MILRPSSTYDCNARQHVQGCRCRGRHRATREQPMFIQVVDVTALAGVDESQWDAVVVLHTIEYGKAPAPAQAFVNRVGKTGKVVVLCRSGAGDFKIEGIAAISSASRMTDVPRQVDEILSRIESLRAR